MKRHSKTYKLSLGSLHLDCNNFTNISVEATIQKFYDVGFLDKFGPKDDIFKCCITFRKMRRRNWVG